MTWADTRELRGLAILAMGNQIRRIDADIYQVRSQNARAGIGLRGIEPIGGVSAPTTASGVSSASTSTQWSSR